jgi:hypothetical protein
MIYHRIVVEDRASRIYTDELIRPKDKVRIAWSLEDHYCQACDYSIGMDDEMWDDEGCVLSVDKILKEFNPSCGAKVFEAENWVWSTCWIDRFLPHEPPRESWTV